MILITIIKMIVVVSYHLLKKHNMITFMEDKPPQQMFSTKFDGR
jgi:hypothetical protein